MYNNEYNIPVSEFARLCGTTRDTLRHYYEIGLLIPHVDSNNGYHYYSISQVSSFYFINSFRKTGFSISKIADMMKYTQSDHVNDVLGKQIDKLKIEVSKLHQQIDSLIILRRILGYHEIDNVQTPGIYAIPKVSAYRTHIENNSNAVSVANIATDLARHIEYLANHTNIPPYPIGATISIEDMRAGKYIYSDVVTLSASTSIRKKIIPLPSTKVVGCFHEDSSKDIRETYDAIIKYIDDNGLKPLSELFSISIFNIYSYDDGHNYLKCLFVCVE